MEYDGERRSGRRQVRGQGCKLTGFSGKINGQSFLPM
jgi:hypothetical protein